jgi:S-adenosylmethionine synthetase
VAIDEQSPDIALGVDQSYEVQHDPGDDDPIDQIGAGDQGMMFGYASNETEELMPLPIMLAHKIARRLAGVRKSEQLQHPRPAGKAQVTVRYEVDEHGQQKPVEIVRLLVSTQHADNVDPATIKEDIIEHVLHPILDPRLYDERRLYDDRDFVTVELTGKFVLIDPMVTQASGARSSSIPGGRHSTAAALSRGRTRRVDSAAYAALRGQNVVAMSSRTARSTSPTRSVSRIPSRSRFRRSTRRRSRSRASRSSSVSTSTCVPARSSATSSSGGRSTQRRRRTGTSAETTTTSRGNGQTSRPR